MKDTNTFILNALDPACDSLLLAMKKKHERAFSGNFNLQYNPKRTKVLGKVKGSDKIWLNAWHPWLTKGTNKTLLLGIFPATPEGNILLHSYIQSSEWLEE